MTCRHPKLIEIDQITLVDYECIDPQGSVTGAFQWKKYTCNECGSLVTVLNAVVEKPKRRKNE
ncbi:hypothetical protein KAR91_68610 [Candidatus Pacearchaeota archaeon]|nr:hypothetical protein [Candidatus Pacearchaeota archaeon]